MKCLSSEEHASVRREYVDGRVFSMTGVTKRHNIIAGNIYSILRSHVRGSQCRAYISDVEVKVESANSFYYPDVMVSCEPFDHKSVWTSAPRLIVEVLSRFTAAIDRREKVLAYRQIDSLREYLIVYQTKQQAELHRKNEDGHWDIFEFGQGAELKLESIPVGSLQMSVAAIYEDVNWMDVNRQPDGDWEVREEAHDDWLDESGWEILNALILRVIGSASKSSQKNFSTFCHHI
jgi:Uma2 family endonuclease